MSRKFTNLKTSLKKFTKKLSKIISEKKNALLIVIFIGVLFRIPLVGTEYFRMPDALEYLNVARNINSGTGIIQSIKWHYFDDYPVVTSAFHGRPIGASVLFSVILKIANNNIIFLQIFSLSLGILNAIAFYFLALKFLNRYFAFFGALIIVLNPNFLITGRIPLSEQVFSLIILLALIINLYHRESYSKYGLIGIICGLSYYFRNEGLPVSLLIFIFISKSFKSFFIQMCVFILTTLPLFYNNLVLNSSLFYSYNYFHFQVKSFSEGMYFYKVVYPSPFNFIQNNMGWIIKQVVLIIYGFLKNIADFRMLGLFSLPILLWPKRFFRIHFLFLAISIVVLVTYSVLWSAIFDSSRHFFLVFLLLLFISFLNLEGYRMKKVGIFLALLTLIIYITFDIHRIVWARSAVNLNPWTNQSNKVYIWINKVVADKYIISTSAPHYVNYFTNNPTAQFPKNIKDISIYNKYVSEYGICYFVINKNEKKYLPEKFLEIKYNDENALVLKDKRCREE